MRGIALVLAAGEGTRMGSSVPKSFIELDGVPLVRRAVLAASEAELVGEIVVAVPASHIDQARSMLGNGVHVVAGGRTRQESALCALDAAPDADAYVVHDAARALAPGTLFDACLRELDECEAVCPALPLTDTIKETSSGEVVRTIDRSTLVAVQTPQAFRGEVYRRAHAAAADEGFDGTDDAALVERLGIVVRIIPGDDRNMKITRAHDVSVAHALLRVEQ